MPPAAPSACNALAIAVIRFQAAAASAVGRFRPARPALTPSGSGCCSTRARRSAWARRFSAAAGSAASAALVTAARSCPVVWPGAAGSTCCSTARASSLLSPVTPLTIASAFGTSICPAASAARVAGSSASESARSTRLSAAVRVRVSAAATSAAAYRQASIVQQPSDRASSMRRPASSATAACSIAAAHDPSRRQPRTTPVRASSPSRPSAPAFP